MYTDRWRILHIINLGSFIATFDIGIVNVALPTMAEQFSLSLGQIQWVVTCYLLTLVALLPLMGKLSDAVGRNRIYSGGFIVFGVGSLLAAIATGMAGIIVSRCIQGIGATMIMANSQAMVRQVFPDNERGRALGFNAVIVSAGTLAGPAIGGILLGFIGWKGLFLINVPLCIIGLLAGLRWFPNIKQAASKNLDLIGTLLLAAAAVMLVLAAEDSGVGTVEGVYVLVISGIVLLAGLAIYEARIKDGILDKQLFKNRTILLGNVCGFFIHLVQMASLIPITFYLQNQLGFDPWISGLILCLQPILTGVVAPFAGGYRDRKGAFALMAIGPAIGALAMAIIFIVPSISALMIILHLALFGIATGCFLATNNTEIMSAAPEHKVSHTGSMLALFRYLGMIAGIGLATVLVGNLGEAVEVTATVNSRIEVLFIICFIICLGVSGLALLRERKNGKRMSASRAGSTRL